MAPIFYYTAHRGDLLRGRLPEGCAVMLVASAHWEARRGQFRTQRPPADHVARLAIDSGGFAAARRYGSYPWTVAQYVDFIRCHAVAVPLDFCACMDYACEPSVNRGIYGTNVVRIVETQRLERLCRAAAPDLPWLSVLQGDSLAERALDLRLRASEGMLPGPGEIVGVGSVCGRGSTAARRVIRFYAEHLGMNPQAGGMNPQAGGVRFHGFGLHIGALDDPAVFAALASWDTYAWTWARGTVGERTAAYTQQPGEGLSAYKRRLAGLYWTNTVQPRLERHACQHSLAIS